jgi:hypothetical protein
MSWRKRRTDGLASEFERSHGAAGESGGERVQEELAVFALHRRAQQKRRVWQVNHVSRDRV